MSLNFISIGNLFDEIERRDKYVLGKKFYKTIQSQIDEKYVNHCRRRVEDIKLEIIDAAENGKKPPVIKGVFWLYKLWYRQPEYKFIAKEFDDWLVKNGLTCTFGGWEDDATLTVAVSTYVDFDAIPEPSTYKLDDILRKRNDKRTD